MTAKRSKLVKIRVAVRIDEAGNWAAYGGNGRELIGDRQESSDDKAIAYCARRLYHKPTGTERIFFLVAELPCPQPETVRGEVEEKK